LTPLCINCWYFAKAKIIDGVVVMPAPSMARRYLPCATCGAPTKFREKDT
jgi:hypothetical protein